MPMTGDEPLSLAEMLEARRRFVQDQDDAEYVEYTLAMERIRPGRRWRRERARFLRGRGYLL